MSKKITKRTTNGLSPKPVVKQDDTVFIVREAFEEEQEGLKTRTAGGVGSLNAPLPTPAAEQPPAAAASSKPLAPLAALWPEAPPGASKMSHGPAQPKASAMATDLNTPSAAPSPKPPGQSPLPTTPRKAVVAAPAVKVTFTFFEPKAKQVSLCGEFNGWSPTATPMKRHDNGHWETVVALSPGKYQYKFLVDSEWIPDPAAQKTVPNQYGSVNSMLEVRP